MTKFGDKAYQSCKQKDTGDRLTKLFEDRIEKIEEAVVEMLRPFQYLGKGIFFRVYREMPIF